MSYEEIAPEDIIRMEEEYTLTFKGMIAQEQHNLDLFNLEVAKFRLKYGMSIPLIHLYGAMGRLSARLMAIESEVDTIDVDWGRITGSFQLMIDKEEE